MDQQATPMSYEDGTPLPGGLQAALRRACPSGREPQFQILRARLVRRDDGQLDAQLRLRITPGSARPGSVWDVKIGYPPEDATAAAPEASQQQYEWLALMIAAWVQEWWDTRAVKPGDTANRVHR